MSSTCHFAEELWKIAFLTNKVPNVTLGEEGIKGKTGTGVPLPGIRTPDPTPMIKAPGVPRVKSSVPLAGGKMLGTKTNPIAKTTPSAGYGGSLVG